MNTVFLYAGQGSQAVGMGKDFYEEYSDYRELIDSFDLDVDIKKLMHEGPLETLSKTENTQPCMSAFAAGVTTLLKKDGIVPDAACGLSLGEYGALFAAGVFSAKDYVELTAFRGNAMMEAARGHECGMSAILGVESSLVADTCKEYNGEGFVTVANYNCPGQYVICGDATAVEEVEKMLKEKGVKKCVRLNVSGPFHTKYMQPAGEELRKYFDKMTFNKPEIPVALNYTGDIYNGNDDIKELLIAQVQNSVRMEDDLRALINAGAKRFIEIGPGKALSGFLKKTAKAMGADVEIFAISTVEDYKKVKEELL